MIKSGFFNSVNQDRVYNAEDFSNIFEGIIKDGIFSHLGNTFDATYDNLTLHIDTGKAWFNGKYIEVVETENLILNGPEYYSYKIDAICIKIDENNRTCGFEVIEGSESNTPTKPAVQNEPGIYRYPMYYVKTQSNSGIVEIEDNRGTESCPWAENATDKNKALYAYYEELDVAEPINFSRTVRLTYPIPTDGDFNIQIRAYDDDETELYPSTSIDNWFITNVIYRTSGLATTNETGSVKYVKYDSNNTGVQDEIDIAYLDNKTTFDGYRNKGYTHMDIILQEIKMEED